MVDFSDEDFSIEKVRVRSRAIALARETLSSNFLVLDTETTGLGSDAQIIEIAILNALGDIVFESYVRPTVDCNPMAQQIHGITSEILAWAPSWPEIHDRVSEIISGKLILIYNSEYDERLIEQTCLAYELNIPNYDARCVMCMYSEFVGEWSDYRNSWRWHKLTKAAEIVGCSEPAHRAAADARMTLGILRAIAADFTPEEVDDGALF